MGPGFCLRQVWTLEPIDPDLGLGPVQCEMRDEEKYMERINFYLSRSKIYSSRMSGRVLRYD